MKDIKSVIAALSGNMSTLEMLLSLVFLPSILAACEHYGVTLTLSTPIEALSGSCYQVPCRFEEVNKFRSEGAREGVWIKSGKDIYTTAHGINKYPIEITGDLDQFNCTTLLSDVNASLAGEYFLRLDNKKTMATACADPLQVTVRDSPWSPSINVPSDLKEHQSVTVTCSAFTPCPHSPPELTWNLQQDSLRQTEKNTDGTFTTKIQENITLSDTHDGYNIRCSARYPVIGGNKTAETEVTLSVSYAPRNSLATICPPGLVSAGSWVELSCSSRAKPPPSFTWFRNSEDGEVKISVGQVYNFNVTEKGEYYCVASNNLGNQTSSVILLNIEVSRVFIYFTMTIVGLVMLCGSVIIFECWLRFCKKPSEDTKEAE